MILAGDVGATKILLEVGEIRSGRWEPALARRYPVEGAVNFAAVLAPFLAEWEEVKPPRARIRSAALGVAGPQQGNRIKMTQRPWTIDGDSLGRRFGIPRVRVVNDLAAAAFGIDWLSSKETLVLQNGKVEGDQPRVVIGVGTGLGIAYLVPCAGELQVVPGEGGHVTFGPDSAKQAELWNLMFATRGRVEAEDIVSGRGLANIYEALTRRGGKPGRQVEPAWVSEQALAKKDPLAVEALNLFAECLGNVAGDFALSALTRGGVYISGGVIARIGQALPLEKFRSAFCCKGAFSSMLMRMPVRAVISERLPVLGAARWAVEM